MDKLIVLSALITLYLYVSIVAASAKRNSPTVNGLAIDPCASSPLKIPRIIIVCLWGKLLSDGGVTREEGGGGEGNIDSC